MDVFRSLGLQVDRYLGLTRFWLLRYVELSINHLLPVFVGLFVYFSLSFS